MKMSTWSKEPSAASCVNIPATKASPAPVVSTGSTFNPLTFPLNSCVKKNPSVSATVNKHKKLNYHDFVKEKLDWHNKKIFDKLPHMVSKNFSFSSCRVFEGLPWISNMKKTHERETEFLFHTIIIKYAIFLGGLPWCNTCNHLGLQ